MSQKLVSILTPYCNRRSYIHKLLDSVLAQTYPAVEMVIIDAGSTDGSADIVTSYVPKFSEKGYKLTCISQKNQGQPVAVSRGLKLVKGDYLIWPDADGHYTHPNAILEMVKALESSDDEVSLVRVQYNVLNDNGEIINKLGVNEQTRYKTDLFEDAVFGANGFWYPPGGYMAKLSKIDELIPDREIYTEKTADQNVQLYLPLLHNHECLTIEKYLYNIVAHDDSRSRNVATNNERQRTYYRTIKKTLEKMHLEKNYQNHLMKKVHNITIGSIDRGIRKRPYRTHTKKAVKGLVPYGLMMLYKRRHQ